MTKESDRDKEIRTINEKSHRINMTPIWKDRHNRRHGKKSAYDHSLKAREAAIKSFSRDS